MSIFWSHTWCNWFVWTSESRAAVSEIECDFIVYMLNHHTACKFWAIKEYCGRETALFIVTFSGMRRWWSADGKKKKVRKTFSVCDIFLVLLFKVHMQINLESLTHHYLPISCEVYWKFLGKEIANRINFPKRLSN
jgi:hypothetical protein